MTKHKTVRADDMYIGTCEGGEVRIVNEAHKLADEAFKNAPVVHKTEEELRIEVLEGKVTTLEQTVIGLQVEIDRFQT